MWELTEEGKRYLKEGLPEIRLLQILDTPKSIEEVREKIKEIGIAIQWAKKNGWIKLESGKLFPLKKPQFYAVQDALSSLEKGERIDENLLRILLNRKLIRKAKKKPKIKEITILNRDIILNKLWKKINFKPYNVSAAPTIWPAKRQPYYAFLQEVRRWLIELGFKEMSGPLIEMEFWNFDALYQAQNHPSRDWTQTYTLKNPRYGKLPSEDLVQKIKATHENGWKTGSTGWGGTWDRKKASQLLPRAHTTACSARRLAKGVEIPGKYFAMARCFRPDVIDATHGVEFNQVEGIVIGDLNFKQLLGILKQFAVELAGAEKVKFYPDYYPFTEPSVQLSAKHPEMGWIEFAGAGIFRPEVCLPLGVEHTVLAWGLGIDRLAMFKLGISDIRNLFTKDLDFLRKSKVV